MEKKQHFKRAAKCFFPTPPPFPSRGHPPITRFLSLSPADCILEVRLPFRSNGSRPGASSATHFVRSNALHSKKTHINFGHSSVKSVPVPGFIHAPTDQKADTPFLKKILHWWEEMPRLIDPGSTRRSLMTLAQVLVKSLANASLPTPSPALPPSGTCF